MVKGSTFFVSILLYFYVLYISAYQDEDKQEYVVYMGTLPNVKNYMSTAQHLSILQEISGESSVDNRLLRSYKKSFNGFAAKLTKSQAERMTSMKGVVSVFPNRKLKLSTTSSWDFMGYKENITKRIPTIESNIIIGVIDGGLWPESKSFNDNGFGPPPKKWKGACKGGVNFTCNNKIIGARFYGEEPVNGFGAQDIGHGSHTASIAAGNYVTNVSYFGTVLGTARGGAPFARIAAYRACDPRVCTDDMTLAAFDDAIADGVDIISISMGIDKMLPFEENSISLGSFHAIAKGILTVQSAGNKGATTKYFTTSLAPWLFSVAASNIKQSFVSKVILGNGKTFYGVSVNKYDMNGTMYPIVYGKSVTSTCNETSARLCESYCFDENLVKGKIVLCDSISGVGDATVTGVVGLIVFAGFVGDQQLSFPFSSLYHEDYQNVVSYVTSTEEPKASISKSERKLSKEPPVRAGFSSRGPNLIISDILKPDITAPGVDIIAAYFPYKEYEVLSGTSMACPHVSGTAAYVKTVHPDWSASMIKSAIMTTAWPMNSTTNKGADFGYGSGHIDPVAAINPGLVYDTTNIDLIAFLCSLKGSTRKLVNCTGNEKKLIPRNLNYPTMTTKVNERQAFNVEFLRTLTNVGTPKATYKVTVSKDKGLSKLDIKVKPDVLTFESLNEKKSFTVTVLGEGVKLNQIVSSSLVWSDGVHTVRSPIVIYSFSRNW